MRWASLRQLKSTQTRINNQIKKIFLPDFGFFPPFRFPDHLFYTVFRLPSWKKKVPPAAKIPQTEVAEGAPPQQGGGWWGWGTPPQQGAPPQLLWSTLTRRPAGTNINTLIILLNWWSRSGFSITADFLQLPRLKPPKEKVLFLIKYQLI